MDNYFSKLNIKNRTLLMLISNSLLNCGFDIDYGEIDIKELFKEAYMQTVALIVFDRFDFSRINARDAGEISATLANNLVANTKVDFEHTRIHSIMIAAEIPYTIIKGFSSALYYPDPIKRSMGDVDFLVNFEDLDKAHNALIKNGFERIKDFHDNHYVYLYNNCRYELHFEISGIPKGEIGDRVRNILKSTVDDSITVSTELGDINVPSDFHQGIITLLHICHHLSGEGIGLRHICDWMLFVSKLGFKEFNSMFETTLKDIGLWKFSNILTGVSLEYFTNHTYDNADYDNKLGFDLMSDILSGGNFGQKSPDRSHEQLILSGEKETVNLFSMVSELYKSANRIVYSHWKISRKFKLLLPFGWIYYGARYFIRSLKGKRPKIRVDNIITEAQERNKMCSQFDLFIV